MVAYENQDGNSENKDSGKYRNSRYGLDLFVKDCLDVSSDYNAGSKQFDSSYFKNRKNKEQKRYGPREEEVDPLELLASIPSIRSYGFVDIMGYNSNRVGNESYGSANSSYAKAGDYSGGNGYSSGRGVADGDYSDNGNGVSYAAADAGVAESYSVN